MLESICFELTGRYGRCLRSLARSKLKIFSEQKIYGSPFPLKLMWASTVKHQTGINTIDCSFILELRKARGQHHKESIHSLTSGSISDCSTLNGMNFNSVSCEGQKITQNNFRLHTRVHSSCQLQFACIDTILLNYKRLASESRRQG